VNVRIALAALVLSIAGCATGPSRPPMTEGAYPGTLADSSTLPNGLFLRQRIDARFGERTMSFSAVLQVDGGKLSLLALTPYGTRAFLIEQIGQDIRFTPYVDRELPFPPRFILIDVHRAVFFRLGEPAPASDGERTFEHEGERITERWRAGKLLERRFERLDHEPKGVLRVRYGQGYGPSEIAENLEIDNAWFGYELSIRTLADD